MKIPKIIHQIWVGGKNKAPEYMSNWKMSGWEYMLWDEKAINEFGLKNRELYDFYYEKEIYHGASDVVRIEVLNHYGGVYIDADTERLKDITPLLKNYDMFAVRGNNKGRIANGVIGSVPNHPVLENYIKAMGTAEEVEPAWSTIGGSMFTKMINQYGTNKTHIYPTRTFYPNNKRGEPRKGSEKVYAIHYWGSTGSSPTKYERN